ncbi:Asp23/Gls24 family envelope stress response protein [Cellulomonas sp. URHD0024]|uniref:Asp23/Gls24 family envelope stress response protein n=1 Tax=Cellulomonas sp. URHD0024 TaxID=1302620 RepID=UPI00040160E2|nr:Asp23/Gls24 family envelope stress response protein [Cellulomonas sp. URHD0024]
MAEVASSGLADTQVVELPAEALPGSLTITDHALERIAGQVARGVPGVAPSSPKVEWHRLGRRARVSLEITLVWPSSAASVAREVQTAVGRELVRQAAQDLDAVTVTVRDVARPPREAVAPRVR